jgi:hypothetical protein
VPLGVPLEVALAGALGVAWAVVDTVEVVEALGVVELEAL